MKRVQTAATPFIAVFLLTAMAIVAIFVRVSSASLSATRQPQQDKLTLASAKDEARISKTKLQTEESSDDGIWHFIHETSLTESYRGQAIIPQSYRIVRLNQDALTRWLRQVPMEFTQAAKDTSVVISLPMPDGMFAQFHIEESPIMEPGLAAQFPEIKTYQGQRLDDRTVTMRCDRTEAGFHAIVLLSNEIITIEPLAKGDTTNYMVYSSRDMAKHAPSFHCAAEVESRLSQEAAPANPNFVSGATLRTFRLALALTGEYTQAYGGGTVSGGLNAAIIAVNSTNAVFEKEVAIRLILIANESAIIFTNPATDGYTHGDRFAMYDENQTRLDTVIGAANYDIGHVFDGDPSGPNVGAGVAAFGVCVNGQKGRGATIFDNFPPTSPSLTLATAHEMGHQFGARHIFNGTTATCASGRDALSAYEPGSGSTIMAYSGLCGNEDLPTRDNYYHTANMKQIIDWSTTGSGGPCAGQIATGNHPPAVNAGADYTIPKSTPFKLTATASDADGDPLTYNWEELDLGPASPPNDDADGQARALFRSYPPVISPSRAFPSLPYILNNANVPPTTPFAGEVLPSITRTMNFQITVRDNHMGSGGVTTDLVQLNVWGGSGPFLVTQPNTAVTWTGGTTQTVTWSVNNTNLSPVNCANVKISLSTDGGNTFPIVLAAGTPNDGSENVTVPNLVAAQSRIKVEAVGNVFFDISDVNLTVTPSGSCPLVSSVSQSIGNPGASVVLTGANFSGVSAVKFANNVTASFTINSNTQITAIVPGGAVTGPITISKTGCSNVQTKPFTISSSPPSDLSADNNPGGFGCLGITGVPAYYVNRLTPASYPATLTSVSIYFPNCGLTVGTGLEVIVGVNADGDANINNTIFQATPVTVQALNQFNTYLVPNVTTYSGDLIVGFRLTFTSGVYPASYDGTNPHQQRAYLSHDGTSFDLVDNVFPSFPGNLGIRARVYSGSAGCPSITGISPASGPPGTVVTITGTNLLNVTQVKFSTNITVSFNIDSDTQITTTVPNGAANGPITISKSGCASVQTSTFTSSTRTPFDFDGDGKTDVAIWRPSNGVWYSINSSNGATTATGWGINGDVIVPGDYDGDDKTDIAVWRPSTGVWYIINSSNSVITTTGWGISSDIPSPGDYDGDGKTDIAVWRPSTGLWYIINSSNGSTSVVSWGVNGDKPVAADYDGDGKTDIAVFRPSNGTWYIINSTTGAITVVGWGIATDKLVPADYDGDGKADVAVFRPSNGTWYIINSATGATTVVGWGANGDVPVPADYDGDGKADVAVWRASNGTWYIINSANGSSITVGWGTSGDVPVPSAFVR